MDNYQIKARPFLLWWVASSLFVWPLAIVIGGVLMFPLGMLLSVIRPPFDANQTWYTLLSFGLIVPILGAVIGFSIGHLQRWLFRKRLYWAADYWRRWSIGGGVLAAISVAGVVFFMQPLAMLDERVIVMVMMPIFVSILSAVQWWLLRGAVREAWLWVLGNLAAGVVFSGLIVMNRPALSSAGYALATMGLWLLAALVQGTISGFVILFLFEKKLRPMSPDGVEAKSQSIWDQAI